MVSFAELPAPEDDGAAAGIEGCAVPEIVLSSTTGEVVDLAGAAGQPLLVYVYPRTGIPGQPLPEGWMETPGAFGCTAESCAFRDLAKDFEELRVRVLGLSAQPLAEQREFAARERIPYALLNDTSLLLAESLGLPIFGVAGMTLYRRLTFVADRGRVEKVFYPVFPPDEHPADIARWLASRGVVTGES